MIHQNDHIQKWLKVSEKKLPPQKQFFSGQPFFYRGEGDCFYGAYFFHWLLIIFKYGHFGVSFMGIVPSVISLHAFCHPNFKILLLASWRILSPAWESLNFTCMKSCTSRDCYIFGCRYLLSIGGCIFVPIMFGLGGATPVLERGT